MWNEADAMIRPELAKGEQLLGSGRPDFGYRFQPGGRILYALASAGTLCMFAIFLWVLATNGLQPWITTVALLVTSGFCVLSRYKSVQALRPDTFYGLTAERALIVRFWQRRRVVSISMRTLSEISLFMQGERYGTIIFGRPKPTSAWDLILADSDETLAATFNAIDDVEPRFAMIRKLQRSAQAFDTPR